MRSGNPVLKDNAFAQTRNFGLSEPMTIQGTVNKTFVLLFIVLGVASWIWQKALNYSQNAYGETVVTSDPALGGLMLVGVIGGLVAALVTIFKPQWSAIGAPVYAAFEGLAIGGISAMFEQRFPGIVVQAVGLTFATLFVMLTAYKTGLIKVTQRFRMGVVAATGGICLFYFVSFILSMFGMGMPLMYSNGIFGVGLSLFVVVIASLNLVLDFDRIETGANQGVPKFMEWYGAFGLMVTLIWLYIEILHLLSKLQSRR